MTQNEIGGFERIEVEIHWESIYILFDTMSWTGKNWSHSKFVPLEKETISAKVSSVSFFVRRMLFAKEGAFSSSKWLFHNNAPICVAFVKIDNTVHEL